MQLPIDALIKFLHVSIYSIYCNHKLAARDFSCNAIFVDFKIALRASISGMFRSTAASLLKNSSIQLLNNFQIDIICTFCTFCDNAICWTFINSALSVRVCAVFTSALFVLYLLVPRRGNIFSFFAVLISRTFNQSGWSNVIDGVVTFSFFDCSIKKGEWSICMFYHWG